MKLYRGRYKPCWAERWKSFDNTSLKELSELIDRSQPVIREIIKKYSPEKKLIFSGRRRTEKRPELKPIQVEIYEIK